MEWFLPLVYILLLSPPSMLELVVNGPTRFSFAALGKGNVVDILPEPPLYA